MPQETETTPLLPSPSPGRVKPISKRKKLLKSRWSTALCYALLVLLGVGAGAGAMLAWQKKGKDGKGPMVPPIYKLPPVSSSVHMGSSGEKTSAGRI